MPHSAVVQRFLNGGIIFKVCFVPVAYGLAPKSWSYCDVTGSGSRWHMYRSGRSLHLEMTVWASQLHDVKVQRPPFKTLLHRNYLLYGNLRKQRSFLKKFTGWNLPEFIWSAASGLNSTFLVRTFTFAMSKKWVAPIDYCRYWNMCEYIRDRAYFFRNRGINRKTSVSRQVFPFFRFCSEFQAPPAGQSSFFSKYV